MAADTEYRHRHPDRELERLKSAEPEPLSDEERDALIPEDLETYTPPAWLQDVAERAERAADELAERATVRVPEEDEELLGESLIPGQGNREADVILQQPVPEVPAALEVTRLNEERRQAERAQAGRVDAERGR